MQQHGKAENVQYRVDDTEQQVNGKDASVIFFKDGEQIFYFAEHIDFPAFIINIMSCQIGSRIFHISVKIRPYRSKAYGSASKAF